MKTNRFSDNCYECGTHIEAEAGRLWKCFGSSSNHFECGDDEEGAWHVSCANGDACKERRVEQQRKLQEKARKARERTKGLNALRKRFWGEGECPTDGQRKLDGERVPLRGSRNRLYGGGTWAVIEPESNGERSVWYVQNNGSDGDDWSHSNVQTGGAGAIGWRLPWSADLESAIRELCEKGAS